MTEPIIDGDIRILVDKGADVLYARIVDSEMVTGRECLMTILLG
jgi:hypothetical protein